MTQIFPFAPTQTANVQFQPTLDGATCTVIVTWNVFGQRYYINIYDLNGNLILCRSLVGSPLGFDIDLVKQYFKTSSMVYRAPTQQFEVVP